MYVLFYFGFILITINVYDRNMEKVLSVRRNNGFVIRAGDYF